MRDNELLETLLERVTKKWLTAYNTYSKLEIDITKIKFVTDFSPANSQNIYLMNELKEQRDELKKISISFEETEEDRIKKIEILKTIESKLDQMALGKKDNFSK